MSLQHRLPDYHSLSALLKQQGVAMTAAEMHGLLSGMLCGGSQEGGWRTMLFDLANEGISFPREVMQELDKLYHTTEAALDEEGFTFNLLLPEGDSVSVFDEADALAGWVNHFLLGLGVMQSRISQVTGEVGEAIDDLRSIAQLGYDEEDNPQELAQALEEVLEYVRVAAMLCHTEFTSQKAPVTDTPPPTLH